MRTRTRWLMAAIAVVAAALSGASARAAGDEGADLSAGSPTATWTGGPFTVATPGTGCDAPDTPTCDHHELEVDPTGMSSMVIEVAPRDSSDLDVYLFDPDGVQVARAAGSPDDGIERLQLANPRTGRYTVSVSAYFLSGGVIDSSMQGGQFDATARLVSETYDVARPNGGCATGVPSVTTPSPAGSLRVDVLVLLDNIGLTRARAVVDGARVTYDDAGIELTVAYDTTFRVTATGRGVDSQGNERNRIDSSTMFAAARAHVGGAPPPGIEAVVVLTRKDLNDFGSDYAGVASCIGALENTANSFALAEAWADERTTPLGLYQPDFSPLVFAHELGHLLNAPHHYGECTFGVGRADRSGVGGQSCTLMQYVNPQIDRTLTTSSMYFSHLNRAVVRSHVAAYAVD